MRLVQYKQVALFKSLLNLPSHVVNEYSFNGALYSLKVFGIATALVVEGGGASVWGAKTYLGVRDGRETNTFLAYRRC